MTNDTIPTGPISVDGFETIASYFDGGGTYLAEVNADRSQLRFTISDSEFFLSTLARVDRPELDEIEWSEWQLTDRFASTPDFTLMDESEIVRIDGVVYASTTVSTWVADEPQYVEVEPAHLATDDVVQHVDADGRTHEAFVVSVGRVSTHNTWEIALGDGCVLFTAETVTVRR